MTSEKSKLFKNAEERERFRAQNEGRSVLLFVTLASIGDAVITTDGDGDITFLNPVAQELTGWALEEAVGLEIERIFKVVDETTGTEIPNPVREALSRVSMVDLPADAMLTKKDGSGIPIDDSAAPIMGMEDEVLGAVLVFRDITDRKKAEKMLKYRSELDRIAARISTAFITSSVAEVSVNIDRALEDIGEFFRADRSYIFLYDSSESMMTCTNEWAAEGIPPSRGLTLPVSSIPYLADKIAERKHISVSSSRVIHETDVAERSLLLDRGVKTLVAVPMLQEDKVLGLVGMESIMETRPWPEDTINLLYLMGNIFASAMARRDAQVKLEAARAREVEIGSRIQQTLLLSPPPLASPDFEVAALTIPSRGIDGDFYDFLLHPNRYLDVIFGDVMGKGVPAALLSAGAKTEFLRSLSHLQVSSSRGNIPQPQDIVNGVHSVLTPQLMNLDSFVTLSYVRLDPQKKKVSIVDCGNTRLMRCAEQGEVEYLSGYNLPLGFSAAEVYSEADYAFSAGDIFVLYSDGVTEVRNPEGEMFGRNRLADLITVKRTLSSDLIVRAIKEAVTAFVGSSVLADDFTCVVIKVRHDPIYGPLPADDELVVSSRLSELATIRHFLKSFCERRGVCGLGESEFNRLELAVNEVASNIIKHAYQGQEDRTIAVHIELGEEDLKVRLSHTGAPFINREKVPPPAFDGSREGGFGLYIIKQAVDEVRYGVDENGRQYVELVKRT